MYPSYESSMVEVGLGRKGMPVANEPGESAESLLYAFGEIDGAGDWGADAAGPGMMTGGGASISDR